MNETRTDIANVIERTFHIRTSAGNGTAFAIEYNGQQYLVTTKHIVKNDYDDLLPGETVRLLSDQGMEIQPVARIDSLVKSLCRSN